MVVGKQFIPISFSPGQLLDEDTLDQMAANELFLRDASVDGKYVNEYGAIVDNNIKLMCGMTIIPPQNVSVVYGTVAFPAMFTPGVMGPTIATSILSPGQNKFMHVVYGIGQYYPDHRGFQFKINVRAGQDDNAIFSDTIMLQWIAMGY